MCQKKKKSTNLSFLAVQYSQKDLMGGGGRADQIFVSKSCLIIVFLRLGDLPYAIAPYYASGKLYLL